MCTKKSIKTYILILIVTILTFVILMPLVACSDRNGSNGRNRDSIEGGTDNFIIDTYRYMPEYINMAHVNGFIGSAVIHDGLIFFCYTVDTITTDNAEPSVPTAVMIESMQFDGTLMSQIEIPVSFDIANVSALHITDEDNFVMILTGIDFTETGFNSAVFYNEYTRQGTEIKSCEITDILPQTGNSYPINEAFFTQDGDVLLLSPETGKTIVYILDDQLSLRGQLETDHNYSVCQIPDGRVLISVIERNIDSTRTVLREVDFSAGDWAETYIVDTGNIRDIYSAGVNDLYDLYIDDGSRLFGYNLATGDKTMILNWLETNIEINFLAFLFRPDEEHISLLLNNRDSSTNSWQGEYVILKRLERADMADIEIITIVVPSMYNTIMRENIRAFNLSSQTYQIEVINHAELYDIWNDENAISFSRFTIDLMTGNAPDIIFGLDSAFNAMVQRGLVLDLYPFIDADPEINRSDFFPNIIKAMESPDGSLFAIPYEFAITTMIAMPDVAEKISSWTFSDMLALVERTDDTEVPLILFEGITAEEFINMTLYYSGHSFINWDENKANLDSKEFIDLLEVTSRFPVERPPRDSFYTSSVTRMLRGEQLFEMMYLSRVEEYQMYTGMLGDDIAAIGLPTPDGGAHSIWPSGFSISANSKNKDAAWSFVRQFLLPDLDINIQWRVPQNLFGFPLRIDIFDEVIGAVKIPYAYKTDDNGNEVEVSRSTLGQSDFMVELFALTDTEEKGLRAIIENASIVTHNNESIENILNEEISTFLSGSRSAADTARILQNRVQTYLNERG